MILTMENSNTPVPLDSTLSDFLKKVLQLTVDGNTPKEISILLNTEELKIEVYQTILIRKFNASNLHHMVRLALEHGFAG